MTDSNSGTQGGFGWLKWAVELLFSKDKDLGLYLLAGLVVMFAIITAIQSGVSADGFEAFAWVVGRVLIVVAILVIALRALRNSVMVRVLGNAIVIGGLVYFAAGLGQFLFSNMFHPPLPTAACLANPTQSGCALSVAYSSAAVDAAPTRDVPEAAPAPEPLVAQSTRVEDGVVISEPFLLEAPPFVPPGNPVFVQFAGAELTRDQVGAVAMGLQQAGWNMQGAEKGGERTLVATGLNEVRYFRAGDEAAAIDLAQAFSEAAAWLPAEAMVIRDFSSSGFQTLFDGQLEIWTSPAQSGTVPE